MGWYKKLIPSRIASNGSRRVPEGVWQKCASCNIALYKPELERSFYVCPKCGYHTRVGGRQRLDIFLDQGERVEIGADVIPIDFLQFKDRIKYRQRLKQANEKTGETDALVVMRGKLKDKPVVAAAFDFFFIGGSMGAVVGERFKLAVEFCLEHRIPLICFATSGGARMQESLVSLFQMAKTSFMLASLSEKKIPFISVLSDPTMGGVSASLATLGDIIIAEPKALIGFAGPRVIEQTVRQSLPKGFQRSEFLLEHGAIDMVIPREEQRDRIAGILSLLRPGR